MKTELKKASKKARATGTKKHTVYNFNKREREPNEDKRFIMQVLHEAVLDSILTDPERQLDFTYNEVNYSVTLTAHRAPKVS